MYKRQVPNGEIGRVYGFSGASDEFNRYFLGAEDSDNPGRAAIVVRAEIKPPGTAAAASPAEVGVTVAAEEQEPRSTKRPALIIGEERIEDTFEPQEP